MSGRLRAKVKVVPHLTFTFWPNLSYIASIIFTRIKIYVRTHVKLTQQWKSTLSLVFHVC